ncbi:hypothetical protein Tco_1052485, partial [Tanacetum coccineum]
IIEFSFRGRLNQLNPSSYAPVMAKTFGVAERLSRTFRAESMGIRAEAQKMLWVDSVSTTYLIYLIPYVLIGLRTLEEEWRRKDTSLTHLKAMAQMKCDTAFGIRRVTRLSEAEILHLWTQFIEPENDSIVSEHGLSSEITQSPGGSSDMSERSENSGSFEDNGRSDEENSKDGASSKEGGSETPQVDDMLVAGSDMAEFNKPKWPLPLVFEMKDIYSEKQVLGYVLTVGVTTVEWESRL